MVLYPVNCLATLQNSQGLCWVIPHKSLKFRTCPSVTVFQENLGGRSAEFAEGWLSTRVNYTSFYLGKSYATFKKHKEAEFQLIT